MTSLWQLSDLMRILRDVLALTSLLLFACPASAAGPWPAVYLETRMFSLWAIGIGLLTGVFFVLGCQHVSWARAGLASLAANVVSVVAGTLLLPLAGMMFGIFAAWTFERWFNWGAFNPVSWMVTLLLAVLLGAGLQWVIYRFLFRVQFHAREFLYLLLANAIPVMLAFASQYLVPVELF